MAFECVCTGCGGSSLRESRPEKTIIGDSVEAFVSFGSNT